MGGPASEQRESMVRYVPVRRPTSVESPRAIIGALRIATNASSEAPYSRASETSARVPRTKGQKKVNVLRRNIAGVMTFIAPVNWCHFKMFIFLIKLEGGGGRCGGDRKGAGNVGCVGV